MAAVEQKSGVAAKGEVGKEVVKGSSVAFVATLLVRFLTLVATVILTRHLGTAQFGVFALGVSFNAIAVIVATLGMDRGLVRFVPKHRVDQDGSRLMGDLISSLTSVVLFGGVLGGILFALSPTLAGWLADGDTDAAAGVLRFFSLGVPLSALAIVGAAFAQSMKKIPVQQSVLTGRIVARVAVAALAAFAGWGAFGVAGGYLAAAGVAALLGLVAIVRTFPRDLPRSTPIYEPRRLLSFSLPLMAAGFIYVLIGKVDVLMVGALSTDEEVGIYSAATRTSLLLLLVLMAVNQITSPTMSGLYASERHGDLATLFRQITQWVLILSLPMVIVTLLLPEDILGVFGGGFRAGGTALAILALGQVVNLMTGPVQRLMEMTGRQYAVLGALAGVIVLDLLFNWLLIPRYGSSGAATATSLSLVIAFGTLSLSTRWLFDHPLYSLRTFLPVLIGAIALGIGFALRETIADAMPIGRFLATAVAVIVFVGLVVKFAIAEDDKQMARDTLARRRSR